MGKVSKLYNLKVDADIAILYDINQSAGDTVRINEINVSCEQNLDVDPAVYKEGLYASTIEGLLFNLWRTLVQYLDHPNMADRRETLERVIRSMIQTSSLKDSFTITVIKEGGLFS